MPDHLAELKSRHKAVKQACDASWASDAARAAIQSLAHYALVFLEKDCSAVELQSGVSGKEYQAFRRNDGSDVVSRPASREHFLCDSRLIDRMWGRWNHGQLSSGELSAFLYTTALAPCLAMELFDRNNKAGPAAYFQRFVGHLVARATGTAPRKHAVLPIHNRNVRLTMDFILDLNERTSLLVSTDF